MCIIINLLFMTYIAHDLYPVIGLKLNFLASGLLYNPIPSHHLCVHGNSYSYHNMRCNSTPARDNSVANVESIGIILDINGSTETECQT
jgi:hypothetical protein